MNISEMNYKTLKYLYVRALNLLGYNGKIELYTPRSLFCKLNEYHEH